MFGCKFPQIQVIILKCNVKLKSPILDSEFCSLCYLFNRYMKCDLQEMELSELDCKFDVILLEPPLEEYQRSQGMVFDKYWSWDEVVTSKILNFSLPLFKLLDKC